MILQRGYTFVGEVTATEVIVRNPKDLLCELWRLAERAIDGVTLMIDGKPFEYARRPWAGEIWFAKVPG